MLITLQIKVSFFVMLLISSASLAACQSQETRTVRDPSSTLVNALMRIPDFPEHGDWHNTIHQQPETPTSENHEMVESAADTLTGNYGVKRYFIKITHDLERYQQLAPSNIVLDLQGQDGFANSEIASLKFVQVGQYMISECALQPASAQYPALLCAVSVNYNHIRSLITVFFPAEMDQSEVETIINQVLTQIDSRIRQIDN